jgi:RNA-binding protein YlmH
MIFYSYSFRLNKSVANFRTLSRTMATKPENEKMVKLNFCIITTFELYNLSLGDKEKGFIIQIIK